MIVCSPSGQDTYSQNHRPAHFSKCEQMCASLFSLIARGAGKKEMQTHPKASKAMDKGWMRFRQAWLKGKGASREDKVVSWRKVKARHNAAEHAVHVGDLLEVCIQKHDQLPDIPENKTKKKHKGRVVYGGHRARAQTGQATLVQELPSRAATLTKSRYVAVHGLFDWNTSMQADATMAHHKAYCKFVPPTCDCRSTAGQITFGKLVFPFALWNCRPEGPLEGGFLLGKAL